MRIAFDGHTLTGKFQGTRTTVANLLKALSRHLGDHTLLVYSDNAEEARARIGEANLQYVDLKSRSPLKRIYREFPRIFVRDRIDVGVFNYITPLKGKSIVFIHDILPMSHPHLFPAIFRWRSWLFFSSSMIRAWRIISVSHYTADMIRKSYPGWITRKVRVISNGPSFPVETYFSPRKPSKGGHILCVGRIEARKNVKLAVEAFLKARPEGIELVVVGSHDHDFDYQLPDDPSIRRVEGIDDEGLIALYRGASLFLYPSRAEGFGLPLLDAILFGIPAISSNLTAMPEVGADLAEYFDPNAPGATDWLADRIRRHFGENPVAAPTKEERRTRATALSWDDAAKRLIGVIEER